jgi:lipopolysaccharide transport system ATP-binding protein
MSEGIVISLRNVSKSYNQYARPIDRLREVLWPSKNYTQTFWALREINIEIKQGETLGIIGRNGSGKSTLLQIIAQTLTATTGEISIEGRICALLELGSGFNPEFTGAQNVFLNGQILGLNKQEISAKFDEIQSFAEIGNFIDQPVKTYSSGMFVRLAFAVAAHCNPQILIVDEALAVGDIFFQQKCFERIRSLQKSGVTIIYVSHDLGTVQSICDRVLLMQEGSLEFDGDPKEAVNRYYSILGQYVAASTKFQYINKTKKVFGSSIDTDKIIKSTILNNNELQRHGRRGLELLAASVFGDNKCDTLVVEMMNTLYFNFLVKANEKINVPNLGIHIYNRMGILIFATGTTQLRYSLPSLEEGECLAMSLSVEMCVEPGEYTFNLAVGEDIAGGDNPNIGFVHDSHDGLGPLRVMSPAEELLPFYGVAQLPVTAQYEFKGKLDFIVSS